MTSESFSGFPNKTAFQAIVLEALKMLLHVPSNTGLVFVGLVANVTLPEPDPKVINVKTHRLIYQGIKV